MVISQDNTIADIQTRYLKTFKFNTRRAMKRRMHHTINTNSKRSKKISPQNLKTHKKNYYRKIKSKLINNKITSLVENITIAGTTIKSINNNLINDQSTCNASPTNCNKIELTQCDWDSETIMERGNQNSAT